MIVSSGVAFSMICQHSGRQRGAAAANDPLSDTVVV